jgi:hypothetical protein
VEYDSLIDWSEVSAKVDAKEPLDPVEQFIYDNEPAGDESKDWRKSLQAALYSFGGAPQNTIGTQPTSTNSAMVPCPQHDALDAGCPLHAGVWLCGIKPCMIAQHQ